MADDLGIMLTELPEAESISDNDLLYLVKENNSEKVKGLTLKNAVNKIQVPEVISTGDKACYVKRSIPTAGALAEGQKIIGATLAWNQLVQNGNFSNGTTNWTNESGVTSSVNSGVLEMTTATANNGIKQSISVTQNHKYIILLTAYGKTEAVNGRAIIKQGDYGIVTIQASTTANKFGKIINYTGDTGNYNLYVYPTETSKTMCVDNVICVDLTQLFGSTIADAIYQMEQTTAGSGVAFFRKYFPEGYYAYESGKLESVNVSAHKAYDSNATEVSSIALDSSKEFRGLYQLVNGELRANGDVYEADGTVTRKYGIVDLGSCTWNKISATYQRFVATLNTDVPKITPNSQVAKIICPRWITASVSDGVSGTITNCIGINDGGAIVVHTNDYADAPTFKTAMSGVYLVYELATPTTETATPYTNPQLVDADGMEEFVDYKVSQGTRDVAIPVGHESSFYDYTDGSITIPDLPFADGTYALSVTMNNGTPTFSWESDT